MRGNDIARTNVPNIRVAYRYETLTHELHLLITAALDAHGDYPYSLLCGSPIHVQTPRCVQSHHMELSLLADNEGDDDGSIIDT